MKDIIISHVKDNDGLSPVILLKYLDIDIDYELLDIYEVENFIKEFVTRDLSVYNNIYITDLTLSENDYKVLEESEYINKVKVFDHHESHMHASDKPYVVIDKTRCASKIFYDYLESIYKFKTNTIDTYINLVNEIDLWTWEKNNIIEASYLPDILSMYGNEIYIDKITQRLKLPIFEFDDFEKQYLELLKVKKERYFENKVKNMIKIKIDDINAGVVFAESYRSELGNYILKNENLDFACLINAAGGISLRASGKVDLNEFAKKYDEKAGGHKNAAGMAFSKELKKLIIKKIFNDCEIIDESI